RFAETQRYIDLHLADAGLTPEKAAAALKISVRQLHHQFEPSGTTFSRYVTRRRLEECRAALMNPIGDRSVTDIALAWGFNSLDPSPRTFPQAFAPPPGEWRPPPPAPPQPVHPESGPDRPPPGLEPVPAAFHFQPNNSPRRSRCGPGITSLWP